MKDYLIFAIFLYLNKNKRTTAREIAQEFEMGQRSVYRYIDALSLLGMPIVTKIGKGGGIEVLGDFCIETMSLSKIEKQTLFEFLQRTDIPEKVSKILTRLI